MALFDGIQNFSPALEGQRIAIGAGQGAGQSISRGMAMKQRGQSLGLEREEFQFKKKQYEDQFERLKMFKLWLDSKLGESPGEDSYWTD